MKQRYLLAVLTTAIFALALAVPLGPSVHAAPPPGARPYGGSGSMSPWCTEWHVAPSPVPPGTSSYLLAVAAVAANNVWAVGYATPPMGSQQTLIEHYDGTAWSIVASPNLAGSNLDQLNGVTALAVNNIWAVGNADFPMVGAVPLIEHYDGTAWGIVASPSVSGGGSLSRVGADAANDLWAVGSSGAGPLTEHYDGTSWSIVPAPSVMSQGTLLDGVSVVNGQAFAAGYYILNGSGAEHTLVEQYASGAWTVMTTPSMGADGSQLQNTVAFSPTNVWAAGFTLQSPFMIGNGLIEHWDGSAWSVVPSSLGSSPTNGVFGIGAIPGVSNLWAVGFSSLSTTSDTYAEQWQGSVWRTATAATPANTSSDLFAVAAISATDAWAVGGSTELTTGAQQPLIEHYAGPPADIFCR